MQRHEGFRGPDDKPDRPSVAVRGASRSFGSLRAIQDVTFSFIGPQIVGVVGPSGCGKTTLIRSVLGLSRLDSGSVHVNGLGPERLQRPGGPRVGYMPQTTALYPELSVRGNVAFFARAHGVSRVARRGFVERALDVVGLSGRASSRIGELSGGMQRRVSLACALVHHPEVLFLDEPTVGQDPDLRIEMWQEFRRLKEAGSLIVLTTHYLAEAQRCDQVLFLREGKVLALDAPGELLRRTGTHDMEDAFLALVHEGPPGNREDGRGPPARAAMASGTVTARGSSNGEPTVPASGTPTRFPVLTAGRPRGVSV